jgi:hypothetical protein
MIVYSENSVGGIHFILAFYRTEIVPLAATAEQAPNERTKGPLNLILNDRDSKPAVTKGMSKAESRSPTSPQCTDLAVSGGRMRWYLLIASDEVWPGAVLEEKLYSGYVGEHSVVRGRLPSEDRIGVCSPKLGTFAALIDRREAMETLLSS